MTSGRRPVDTVESEVRELVRRRGLDPITDLAAVRGLVDDVVTEYDEGALTSSLAPLADARTAARTVFDVGAGFGPLQRHLVDSSVEGIWINGSTGRRVGTGADETVSACWRVAARTSEGCADCGDDVSCVLPRRS